MDENNQYGIAVTQPLPYGCIKRKSAMPSFEQLKQLLKSVTLEDKIGHIFTVDIEFSDISPKTLLFNEIFPPIFEKNKKIPPHLQSCSQIMSRAQKKDNKDEITSLPFNSKTHAILNKKILWTFMQKIYIFWQLVQDGRSPKFTITTRLNNILSKKIS